ncbi:MAG: putative beta-lysine N-acetyltransferase [Bdellovibrionales bacterium GWB1_55_8]|nr:MAG: putative beta-lysine N-acetyltransferase [Bdellovibrionales bacterium GWB1_55_8]
MDVYNQRIKISNYLVTDFTAFILKVRWITEANGFDKIICMARHEDWEEFLKFGYVLEAVLKYYHNGEDAFVVSKFRSQERLTSQNLMDEILLIEKLMSQEQSSARKPLPDGFIVRLARREDIPQLLELYKTIFESYPSPLIHQSYLETIFQKESLFAVCAQGDVIAAAASAELYPANRAAELTDCATLSGMRGLGLMSHILAHLERTLESKKYVCAYTMARARSFGMNSVFYHLRYEFMGRLVNNCDIYGAYEDMNIWVRKLSSHTDAIPCK